MKKLILFMGLLCLLASCSDNYKYQIKRNSGIVDTITIREAAPTLTQGELQSTCGCSTYEYDVKSFKFLGKVKLTKEEINDRKQVKIFIFSIVGLTTIFLLIWISIYRYTNSHYYKQKPKKQNIMFKILKYIVYGVGIILIFKIGLILIQYIPTIIENHLK